MAKQKFNLKTRNSRRTIPVGPQLHVSSLIERLALCYRKGKKGGTWTARRHEAGTEYRFEPLGTADDAVDADGIEVLTYDQAKDAAEAWFKRKNEEEAGKVVISEKYTVADAMADYLKEKTRTEPKPPYTAKQTMNAHILPSLLASIPLSKLNHDHVKNWRDALLEAGPRVRTPQGQKHGTRNIDKNDPDTMRKRRASVNRIFTVLKAALNFAHEEGRVANKAAWERLKPFKQVDVPKVVWMTQGEAQSLVEHCDADFAQLVWGGLITACRYEELCQLKVGDFSVESEHLFIAHSKNGESRHIDGLKPDEIAFFVELTQNRKWNEFLFLRSDGDAWGESDQKRRMNAAVEAAGISKPVTFHVLRHTWATLAAQAGVPLQTIAYRLGDKDMRTVQRHYAHHCPSHGREQIRTKGPSFGFRGTDKVIPFPKTGTSS